MKNLKTAYRPLILVGSFVALGLILLAVSSAGTPRLALTSEAAQSTAQACQDSAAHGGGFLGFGPNCTGLPDVVPIVSAITASAHDGNLPANAIDGSLATRWSAEGAGQWIELTLREQASVGKVAIAWHQGDQRVSSFNIETSADGTNWTKVHEGSSSGTTLQPETYDVADTAASKVRITGFGNTVNPWNSITEILLAGTGSVTPTPNPTPEPTPEPSPSPTPTPGTGTTLFNENFDRFTAGKPFHPYHQLQNVIWPTGDSPNSSSPRRGMWIERHPSGTGNVMAVHYPIKQQYDVGGFIVTFPDRDKVTLNFRMMFGSGFQLDRAGGKLPGLGGAAPGDSDGKPPMHCDSSPRDAGFSARHMWGNKHGGAIAIYPYHEGEDNGCAPRIYGSWQLYSGRWYDVKQEVTMNTKGKFDGSIVTYIDGKVYSRVDNLALAYSDHHGVNQLIVHLYFGGKNGDTSYQHSRAEVIYFDDMSVTSAQ